MFTSAFPILATTDMARSLAFYRDLLDAEVTYRFPPEGEGDPGYVALELGSSHLGIGLDPGATDGAEPKQRFSLWVYAEDCDAAVERLRSAAVTVLEEPVDQPWGERVARVQDPDGNLVIIGSPPG